MRNSNLVKATLALSGMIALGVGFGILFIPHSFHASAGIAIGDDVNLLNEMRAPGGMLLFAGLFILYGAIRSSMAVFAMIVSSALYLSFGASRVVALALDGMPNSSVLQILALELIIGAVCVVVLRSSWTSNRKALR